MLISGVEVKVRNGLGAGAETEAKQSRIELGCIFLVCGVSIWLHFLVSEPDPDLGFQIKAGFVADPDLSLKQGKVLVRDGHRAGSEAKPESGCIFWIRSGIGF